MLVYITKHLDVLERLDQQLSIRRHGLYLFLGFTKAWLFQNVWY